MSTKLKKKSAGFAQKRSTKYEPKAREKRAKR